MNLKGRQCFRWATSLLLLGFLNNAAAQTGTPDVQGRFKQLAARSLANWQLDATQSKGSPVLQSTPDITHTGEGSLLLEHKTPGSAVVVSDPVTLRVGRAYRLSGWIKTENVHADAAAKYPTAVPACLTMESFPFTNHSPAVGGTSDWTHVETVFIATRIQDKVRLHLGHNGTATGKAWFDEIQLTEVHDVDALIPLKTVRWSGEGYRYDDRGWIFVHIEGEPYQRGFQFGSLVADEIVDYIKKLAIQQNEKDPASGWQTLRFETDTLFLRGYDAEYLTEMKGIADGAAKEGARYDDRPLDLLDIVTVNSAVDLGQLHEAMTVTPHALTGESFLQPEGELQISERSHKCSAFAATGPATAGGQVVFGQIFMWSGFTGVHWNMICDIVPNSGHRLVYQTFPGGIHSGADFYINSAGIIIGETTTAQTPFEPRSTPQSNRIRKAAQYAASIDDVERILWENNNGLYTNDWPIADIKTGEVAMLLLGTHKKKMWRTGENMDPFGTPGFLWTNNNNRDLEVRKEYAAQPEDRPFDLAFTPWNRDIAFNDFYQKYKGKFDSSAAVDMWASSPINRAHACDGKITTTEMARELVFLAHHGKVTLREKFPMKDHRIMPDLPGAVPHLSLGYSVASPIWVTEMLKDARKNGRWIAPPKHEEPKLELDDLKPDFEIDPRKLWRRTVFPAAPADNWFVSASAAYWKILRDLDKDKPEKPDDKLAPAERISKELGHLNRRYLYLVNREDDLPAVSAAESYVRYSPYQIPRIKGTFGLHQLRLLMGTESFLDLMEAVHLRYGNTEMSTAQLLATVEERAGNDAIGLLKQWITRKGLPQLVPAMTVRAVEDGKWEVQVRVTQSGDPHRLFTHVAIDTGKTRHLRRMEIGGPESQASWTFDQAPARVEFNALNDMPTDHESFYVWANLIDDFHDAIIVYGTARQDEANHTLARRWQEKLADAYLEILLPLVKDSELTPEQAASHDLIVMGTLNDNRYFHSVNRAQSLSGPAAQPTGGLSQSGPGARVEESPGRSTGGTRPGKPWEGEAPAEPPSRPAARANGSLPVHFGQNHFEWRGLRYDDPDDGLFLVAPNPFNPQKVMYVLAANSAIQLHQMTKKYTRDIASWAVYKGEKIVRQGFHPRADFTADFPSPTGQTSEAK